MTAWISSTNKRRWFNQSTQEEHEQAVQKLKDASDQLLQASSTFVEEERMNLIKPYEQHFKDVSPEGIRYLSQEGARNFSAGARPLFLCLTLASNLHNYVSELHSLSQEVIKMASKRPKNHILWPTGLRKIGHILVSKKVKVGGGMDFGPQDLEQDHSSSVSTQNSVYHEDDFDQSEEAHEDFDSDSLKEEKAKQKKMDLKEEQKRAKQDKAAVKMKRSRDRRNALKDADALPPSKWFHHLGRALASAYHFIWSPTGIFALRCCIGTFSLWIIAVLPNTAAFAYQNRAIWAIITVSCERKECRVPRS